MLTIMNTAHSIVRGLLYLAAAAGMAMSFIVFISVLSRYLLTSPVGFADEVVALLFATIILLTFPFLFLTGKNISVGLIADSLGVRFKSLAEITSNLVSAGFLVYLGYLSTNFALLSYQLGARTDVARLPEAPWMALMPVSFFLSALAVLIRSVIVPTGGDEEGDGWVGEV